VTDGAAIRLLTQYAPLARKNPRENRMTAALTAVLAQDAALAGGVAQAWLGTDTTPTNVTATMHRAIGGRLGWVDLQLEVPPPQNALIWVEAKLGSGLSGADQLDKYLAQLKRFGGSHRRRLLLLLVPAQDESRFEKYPRLAQAPPGDHVGPFLVTWQELHVLLDSALTLARGPTRWLLKEVLAYMKDEKIDAAALRPKHVKALEQLSVARAAAQALADATIERLQHDGWITDSSLNARPIDILRSAEWLFGFRTYKRQERASVRTHPRLAWGIYPPTVSAGVCFERDSGGVVKPRKDADWQSALITLDGWEPEEDPDHKTLCWVTKHANLVEVVGGGAAHEQVDALSRFVAEAFEEARAARRTAT
jgi:hypothetical protein